MRITVVSGNRQVVIHIKDESADALARAEAAAHRLMAAGPGSEPPTPFGYTVTSDHEVADPGDGDSQS
ncbi:hypothetical protein [Streptomyces sp. NPDC052496]|uniref:hypothetical protein n=1 Tax=Streptomyces sp. NPDC052496 TaxID=3154951 RepID=UPI00343F165B